MNWEKVINEYKNYISKNPFSYQPLYEWLDERYEVPKVKEGGLGDSNNETIVNNHKNEKL